MKKIGILVVSLRAIDFCHQGCSGRKANISTQIDMGSV